VARNACSPFTGEARGRRGSDDSGDVQRRRKFQFGTSWSAYSRTVGDVFESGRQPWIVQGLQLTRQGVSPSLDVTSVALSLVLFFLLYAVLAVVDMVLMLRYARREPGSQRSADEPEEPLPAVTY